MGDMHNEIILQVDLETIIEIAQENNQKIYLTNGNFDVNPKWSNKMYLPKNHKKCIVILREYIAQHNDKLVKMIFLPKKEQENDILIHVPYKFNMHLVKKKLISLTKKFK